MALYASSIEISLYLMKMALFRKKHMDYVKISTVSQAADGADNRSNSQGRNS